MGFFLVVFVGRERGRRCRVFRVLVDLDFFRAYYIHLIRLGPAFPYVCL